MKFREIIKYEKENMNRIRYIMNYRIVPIYFLLVVVIITVVGITMSIDDKKYEPLAIVMFVIFGVISIALLSSVPFVRKKEIACEMKRYNFEEPENKLSTYNFSDQEITLLFDEKGMTVNNTFYWYNHLETVINTSNHLMRILITICFIMNEEEYIELPFTGETIHMIKKFRTNLLNQEDFEYILDHKEEAFTKIYKTGHV